MQIIIVGKVLLVEIALDCLRRPIYCPMNANIENKLSAAGDCLYAKGHPQEKG